MGEHDLNASDLVGLPAIERLHGFEVGERKQAVIFGKARFIDACYRLASRTQGTLQEV